MTLSTTLARPDVVLHYTLTPGNARNGILFIQGVGAAGEAWRPQVEALQSDFSTLRFDNRGLGHSQPCRGPITIEAMADDARALLDEAGWASAHVVGHSLGGVIAQQLALDHPRRVRSLSLLCTFVRGKDAARLTPWVLWMTLRTRIGSRRMRRRAFLEMIQPPDQLPATDPDAVAARVADFIGRDLADHPPVLWRQLRALARHDASSRLSALGSIPTLVLSAAHDRIAKPAYGRALAEAIPGATFECLPDASHGVPLLDPDAVNPRLHRFLHSVDHPATSR